MIVILTHWTSVGMAKKGKKGKGKKSAGGDGEKTPRPGKEEPLSVMESIMSFQ